MLIAAIFASSACSGDVKSEAVAESKINHHQGTQRLEGSWIVEPQGVVMEDPQTSGLVAWRGKLLSISDRSAVPKQRMRLHVIEPSSGKLVEQGFPISLSDSLKSSCFAEYIGDNPDLEALLVDPQDDKVFYTVTEDASSFSLSDACEKRFSNTGSTDYPTVLVRMELQSDDRVLMTHARPVQFAAELEVGNYPNDGIEGLTIDKKGNLYLGLEKDDHGQPRIFSIAMGGDFWSSDDFASAKESGLILPKFEKGNHPINALQYLVLPNGKEAIAAAARNDDQLWIAYLDKETPTDVIDLTFWAPTHLKGSSETLPGCDVWELMDNSSIEGVAVLNGDLWMVNDPWKRNYLKNIQCESNADHYKRMSPLLFKMPLASL
ncbi:hypothetical protein EYS14_20015 [Alteromonadaceae bacterium M269]|nr:hypothetical protein EYS14_20015 [Alteromonadaceae bacterium M269]